VADFYLNQNDTASPIFETLTDDTGAAVDIQGATVKLTATPIHGGTPIVNAHAANNLQVGDGSDGSRGDVSYGEGANPWTTETATAGDFLYTWEVTFAGGTKQTYPNTGSRILTITPDAPTTAQEYASREELKKTLNLSGTTYTDQDISLALSAATTAINVNCGRVFTLGSPGESRTYRPISDRYLLIDDVVSVSAVTANGTALTVTTDYVLEPVRVARPGPPYDVLRSPSTVLTGLGTWGQAHSWGDVVVTGQYGWPSVPAPIKQATMILASRYLQRSRSAPFAILTFGDGGEAARLTRSDPDVAMLLGPYTRSTMIE
jgi:hypothetical protein